MLEILLVFTEYISDFCFIGQILCTACYDINPETSSWRLIMAPLKKSRLVILYVGKQYTKWFLFLKAEALLN